MKSYRARLIDRWFVTLLWPVGVTLTAWDYMWRSTPMHRRESRAPLPGEPAPPLPSGVATEDLLPADGGHGPLFHRRYRTQIRDAELSDTELVAAERLEGSAGG